MREPHPQPGDHEVVVIGAGQAGLAMGYYLARQGRRFIICERGDSIAPAWRERWDSLKLFTPSRYSSLPGLQFPGDPDGYPTRDDVIAYLERYAETFELPIELNSNVRRLSSEEGRFVLDVDGRTITADQVVVATGPFQTPYVPKLAEDLDADVWQVHSTGYRSPSDVPQGIVLVVGGGNTGFQIAKELSSGHRVYLSVGSRQKPLPQRVAGRDLFWYLTKTGLIHKTVESRLGRRLKDRDTLIGSSPRELKRRYGVELTARVTAASGRTVRLEDGGEVEADGVVWATGYRSDYAWIDLPILDSDGRLQHRRGVTDVPGLYFLGLTWQHTRGSALIGWVKDDARFIAERLAPLQEANMHDHSSHGHPDMIEFPSATEGLPDATRPEIVELSDGDEFDLEIAPVRKQIGDATVRMLAYNGSVPGPTLRVPQDATITVHATNRGDIDATVHWHGLRLENRYDGTHETQAPIPIGETFSYQLTVPDPGAYWYHPHIREDYGQELGLYGNILVVPNEDDYWSPAHRELLLTLDDVLIENGRIAPFRGSETTHVAMGRFGNVILVAGEPDLALEAKRGEVVRFHFTNTANTRVFNVTAPGARMKLVGADSGHYEREEHVDEVLLAPSERVVVDVLFDEPGELALEHRTPEKQYRLAVIEVVDEPAEPDLTEHFETLRTYPDMGALRDRIGPFVEAPPDKTLSFVAEMDEVGPEGGVDTGVCACPMDPEIVASWAGKCPKCGMKLMPAQAETEAPTAFACPMHAEITATWAATCPTCGMTLRATGVGDAAAASDTDEQHHGHHQHGGGHAHGAAQGIEWEDDMVEVNRMTTPANTRWKLVDTETGAENAQIDWTFRVGDQVKLRLVNEMDSDHPMPHPFHVHGAGRFLILARDGVVEPNLVWKDTVLVRTGETVDILLDVTNPGRWMAHCHIAEHHESGMMLSFDVTP